MFATWLCTHCAWMGCTVVHKTANGAAALSRKYIIYYICWSWYLYIVIFFLNVAAIPLALDSGQFTPPENYYLFKKEETQNIRLEKLLCMTN